MILNTLDICQGVRHDTTHTYISNVLHYINIKIKIYSEFLKYIHMNAAKIRLRAILIGFIFLVCLCVLYDNKKFQIFFYFRKENKVILFHVK